MPRFHSYTQQDSLPIQVGDVGFKGVNNRLEPHLLPPGMVSDAKNMRFNRGVPETRLGTTFQTWANKIISGQIQAWGIVYGVGVFTDPATRFQYLIIAADGNIYFTLPNNSPVQMVLPVGLVVNKPCTFTQGIGALLCHQGEDRPTLVTSRITQPWVQVINNIASDGTTSIPNSSRSIFTQNRIFIPYGKDQIAVSDFNDYTRYLAGLQDFSVNQGSADTLVNIYKFNDETIVAFKDHSIYAISGVSGTLQGTILDEVTNKFGLIAAKSIAQVGNDLWFLSELGVMSLSQTELNKLQGVSLPQSDPIQPYINRINWRYASGSTAAYWNNRYYLAVPFDDAEVLQDELCSPLTSFNVLSSLTIYNLVAGATYRWIRGIGTSLVNGTQTLTASADFTAQGITAVLNIPAFTSVTDSIKRVFKGVNNAILVYDFLNQSWSGYDQAEGLMVQEFFLLNYNGERRLFFISNDGWVKLYEESFEDQLAVPYAEIIVTGVVYPDGTLTVNSGSASILGDGGIALGDGGFELGEPGGQIKTVGFNTNNTPDLLNWGISPSFPIAASIAANLFTDSFGNGGFYPGATNPWPAPNTQIVTVQNGIRFYSTNGSVPSIIFTPATPTVSTILGEGGIGLGESRVALGEPGIPDIGLIINEVGTVSIESTMTSRGFISPGQDLEDFFWLSCDLQLWNSLFDINLLTEGAGEIYEVVDGQSKDRTKFYRPFTHIPYAVGNVNGDATDKYRQDYSLRLGPNYDPTFLFGYGANIEQHQETREVYRTKVRGRSVRTQFVNSRGRIRIMSIKMEGKQNYTRAGTFA